MAKPLWIEYLEYLPIIVFEKIVKYIPHKLSMIIASIVGYVIFIFSFQLKKESYKNLCFAFANTKSDSEIRLIRRKCFVNVGKSIFEVLGFSKFNSENLMDNIRLSDNSLNTIKALHKKGKGIICISAHYSNWELLALVIPYLGYLLNIIIRPLDNSLLNTFINKRRMAFGAKIMDRKNGYYQSCRALRNNEVIALLVDQNQVKGGIFVPFFAKLASTARGAASMARRTNASVMLAYIYRDSHNVHTLTFKEIKLINSKSIKEFIYINTKRFSSYFEDIIKDKPDQWLWFHDRWKTRP